MAKSNKRIIVDALADDNPITTQVLGVCSALAVTGQLKTSLVMSAALTAVLVGSNLVISLMRNVIPNKIRMIVELAVIASLVIVADEFLRAKMYDVSKELSVFVGLIITNCIVMGRAEAFALQNPPSQSIIDGIGNGLGYSIILILVGAIREVFGSGTLLGYRLIPEAYNNGLMVLPPAAFIVIGLLIWAQRTYIYLQKHSEEN